MPTPANNERYSLELRGDQIDCILTCLEHHRNELADGRACSVAKLLAFDRIEETLAAIAPVAAARKAAAA